VEASFGDLAGGARRPVRAQLRERLETLAPVAERIGCAGELAGAKALVERNGAQRQREVGSPSDVAGWLADRFLS
jgi:carboxylate-amine ligase